MQDAVEVCPPWTQPGRCPDCCRLLLPHACCARHPDAAIADAARETRLDSLPGTPIGGFEPRVIIGRGGFSTVYLARRADDARDFAVKRSRYREDRRLQREADMLRALGPPTVPAYVAHGVSDDGYPFLAMEYLASDSVARRMAAAGESVRPENMVADVLAVCDALERIHDAGVVHRDLKPENLFLRLDGSCAIIDFGIARYLAQADAGISPSVTRTGEVLGTPLYMAPEQCRGQRGVDHRTDVYSLGVLLFEWLTGIPPFAGPPEMVRLAHMSNRAPLASRMNPELAPFDAVIQRAMAKEIEQRFAHVADLRRAFAQAAAADRRPVRGSGNRPRTDENQRPMAFLIMPTHAHTSALGAWSRTADAVLVACQGERHMFAFPWAPSVHAGIESAIDGVLETDLATGSCVVHVARARIKHTRLSAVRIRGAIDDWFDACRLPADQAGERALWLTRAAAGYASRSVALRQEGSMARVLEDAPVTLDAVDCLRIPLVGRDRVLAALSRDIGRALRGRAGLFLVVGARGLGKTRVLHALSQHWRADKNAQVIYSRGDAMLFESDAASGASDLERARAIATDIACLDGSRDALALRESTLLAQVDALVARSRERPLLLCIDDAHRADRRVVDAVERALARDEALPLACVMTAPSQFLDARPNFPGGSGWRRVYHLERLDQGEAAAVLRELLRPVEFLSEDIVARLHERSRGNPQVLVQYALWLRERGAIRAYPGNRGYFLASDEALQVEHTGLEHELAAHALERLSASLDALVRVCAVLGDRFSLSDIEGVQTHWGPVPGHEPFSRYLVEADASVGLRRLCERGLLLVRYGRYSFRLAMLAEAIERATPGVLRHHLHRLALERGRVAGDWPPARLAHHAARCGADTFAADMFLAAAESMRAAHRFVQAEEYYGRALERSDLTSSVRMAAWAGRGRTRLGLQRMEDALDDIRRAIALARTSAMDHEWIRLRCDEAMLLDWLEESEESARIAEEVERAVAAHDVMADVDLAVGRALYRRGREGLVPAIARFERAMAGAEERGDIQLWIKARLLYCAALVYCDRLDDAERGYRSLLHECQTTGDRFHLATAYLNRSVLWHKRHLLDRHGDDLRACIAIARELGHAQLERLASFNRGELLYWHGDRTPALSLARRARALQMRYFRDHPNHHEALLLARILCTVDARASMYYVRWIRRHCQASLDADPLGSILAAMCVLATQVASQTDAERAAHQEQWRVLENRVRQETLLEEAVEVPFTAAAAHARPGLEGAARTWLRRARALAGDSPIWRPRLEELARVLDRATDQDALV